MTSCLTWIFNPNYWIMLCPYSENVDNYILNIVEKKLPLYDSFHDKLEASYSISTMNMKWITIKNEPGGDIWIGNYPYGYATMNHRRPSRCAIMKLKEYITDYNLIHKK